MPRWLLGSAAVGWRVLAAAGMVAATWRLVIAAIDETGLPPDPAASPSGAAAPPG